jgi:hypothetical protein
MHLGFLVDPNRRSANRKTMMDISIRLARMEDIPALKELIHESARELSKSYYTEQHIESAIKYIFGAQAVLTDMSILFGHTQLMGGCPEVRNS